MRVILPGSYDPVTLGHLDLIRRAAETYDEVYAVIFVNPEKTYTFSLDDRLRMLALATEAWDNVLVSAGGGLVIDYMREHDIDLIVKGYRDDRDLAYENGMAAWNLAHGGYETRLLPCEPTVKHISSTAAREALRRGEELSGLLPEAVIAYLKDKATDYKGTIHG